MVDRHPIRFLILEVRAEVAPNGEADRCGADPGHFRWTAPGPGLNGGVDPLQTKAGAARGVRFARGVERCLTVDSRSRETSPRPRNRREIRAVGWDYAGRSGRMGGTISDVNKNALQSSNSKHLAIYTGSFDPITLGHVDVLARARTLFDEIVLAIGHNPEKEALFTMEERAEMAEAAIATDEETSGAATRVVTYEGLTVDFARRVGACAIIRGLRNSTDLATESQLAITNRKIAGIETVFIVSGEEHAYTSSSLIRQMAALGASIEQLSTFVPPVVFDAIRAKQGDAAHPLGRLLRDPLLD